MSTKNTFSFENALTDVLGFIKKLLLTIFDATVRPWKIMRNSGHLILNGKDTTLDNEDITVEETYVSHFLYFTISVLVFLSYYKYSLIQLKYKLNITFKEYIINAGSNFFSSSMLEKLLENGLFLFVSHFIVVLLSRFLAKLHCTTFQATSTEADKYFRKCFYYFLGTFYFISLLLPLFTHLFFSPATQTCLFWIIPLLYSLYYTSFFPSALFKKRAFRHKIFIRNINLKQSFKTILKNWRYNWCILLIFFLIDVALLRFCYKPFYNSIGYISFTPKVTLSPASNSPELALRGIQKISDSTLIVKMDVIISNTGTDCFLNNPRMVRLRVNDQHNYIPPEMVSVYFSGYPVDAASVKKDTYLYTAENKKILTTLVSEPISLRKINFLRPYVNGNTLAITYHIYYTPYDKNETNIEIPIAVSVQALSDYLLPDYSQNDKTGGCFTLFGKFFAKKGEIVCSQN